MAPEERAQFGQLLQQRAQDQRVDLPELREAGGQQFQDPGMLAQLLGGLHQQQPGLVGQLLGGGGGGGLLGGGGGGGAGGVLGNPLAKAALAGIAAMAAKRMLR
jgi:hypothetical protein